MFVEKITLAREILRLMNEDTAYFKYKEKFNTEQIEIWDRSCSALESFIVAYDRAVRTCGDVLRETADLQEDTCPFSRIYAAFNVTKNAHHFPSDPGRLH